MPTSRRTSIIAFWTIIGLMASGRGLPGQSDLVYPREEMPSWIPKYVFSSAGPPTLPGTRIRWNLVLSKGDLDRDGSLDYMAYGGPAGGTGHDLAVRVLGGIPVRDLWYGSESSTLSRTLFEFQTIECPSGLQLLLADAQSNIQWACYSFPGPHFQRSVPIPPGPPGYPVVVAIWSILPAGDQDGDGWEELLLHAGAHDPLTGSDASVPILLDGATLLPTWSVPYSLDAPVLPLKPDFTPLHQDIDGDGCEDFLTVGGHQIYPFTGRWFGALSGADGSLLWAKTEALPPGVFPSQLFHSVPDMDGDGILDVASLQEPVSPTPGRFSVMSGATGSLIWENLTIGTRMPGVLSPGSGFLTDIYDFSPLGDLNRDGVNELGIYGEVWRPFFPNELQRIWVFDGASGRFLMVQDFQADLTPFFSDSRTSTINQYLWPIGDVDADGYFEWLTSVYSGDPQVFDRHLAVFGQRTLKAPNTIGLAEAVGFELDIPSGVSAPFHLLLSSGFDWLGSGLSLGMWDTQLASSALLAWSQAQSSLSGVLDSEGRGIVHVTVPNNTALLGSTFFAKAWIEDPVSPGQVLTMSSLVIFRVE